MKKILSILLAALLVACSALPAFAAGGTVNVTFHGPSAEFEGGYAFYKTENGEFKEFEEDPDGGYVYYSVDNTYYFLDDLIDRHQKIFTQAEPGTPESKRYSPAEYQSCTVDKNNTVSFKVFTSEKYDIDTVTVMCNGKTVQKNGYGEYSITADKNLDISVQEYGQNNMPVLLRSHFTVTLTSGDGYAAKPLRNTNNKVVYYGDDYEFRVRITKGFNGDSMKVKVIRGSSFLAEYIGEEADTLSSIMGEAETLSSTGVDEDGYRTYKIKNITSDCKVLISGVNKDSSSGVLATLKRILRLILGLLGINLDGLLGEDNNPLAAHTVTLKNEISSATVSYTTNPEFKLNNETGNMEAEVLSGECITIVVTKQFPNTNVKVTWDTRDPEDTYTESWQSYYNLETQKTTYSAVWYVDGITSDTTITITATD